MYILFIDDEQTKYVVYHWVQIFLKAMDLVDINIRDIGLAMARPLYLSTTFTYSIQFS